ncbi:hypothetical protein HYC85_020834 [Camellia sinensis]|uniref:Glycosyltransferase family 92 protein n=1 Tax=Camellia sinensis TaxID=4442 RepID=A0A7J7GQY2_CAMSI|nr:hypothetical protein HYC85_020834 [Camellia sinensis]
MARKVRTTFVVVVATFVFLASIYHHLIRDHHPIISSPEPLIYPQTTSNYAILEDQQPELQSESEPEPESEQPPEPEPASHQVSRHVPAVSILLPSWEVLVIVSPEIPPPSGHHCTCLFHDTDSSPAKPSGTLPFPNRTTFICEFPASLRRQFPFVQPILTTKSLENPPERATPAPELLRWNFLVYQSLSTENDVVVFVKGINNRQGINRSPNQLRCVFGDDLINGVKTSVTSSMQEVFRCQPPPEELTAVSPIKISLEISDPKKRAVLVPSVAYYTPPRKIAIQQQKSLICACTMVYNIAKFLKEWVVYHSEIGIERFILYDNDSDDELEKIVEEVIQLGYNVSTLFWPWPKTQEAGFSHCAISSNKDCRFMIYIDVDEFVYSPSWLKFSKPSDQILKSLLPKSSSSSVGQVMIPCFEFGPSNQKSHPIMGVTQGYNCRRRSDNRHKSIVLLDAIDVSLLNVVHHFRLKKGYRSKKLRKEDAVVNHYKFQVWDDFKTKFRRRVSAYVADWTQNGNLRSKDRTPGLGYAPVEPRGWSGKFCQVYDDRLKDLTKRWFGLESPSGYQMAWQR